MTFALAVLTLIIFVLLLGVFRVPKAATSATKQAAGAVAMLRSASLSDREKEARLRRVAVTSARDFLRILLLSILAAAAAFAILLLLTRITGVTVQAVLGVMQRLDVVGGTVLLAAVVGIVRVRS